MRRGREYVDADDDGREDDSDGVVRRGVGLGLAAGDDLEIYEIVSIKKRSFMINLQ